MVKRNPNKKHYNWCDFGKHYIQEGDPKQHVYPVPVCDAFPDGGAAGDGATACGECHPKIEKLQIEQGILLVE